MSGRREPLSAGAALRTVAGREIRERLRAKSFRIGTALLIVVIVGIGVIARLAGGDEPDDLAIGVVGDGTEQVATSMRDAADVIGRGVEVTPYDDVAAARAAVGEGDLDAAVLVDDQVIVFDDGVDDQVLAIAQQAWAAQATRSALADLGVADADIAAALTPAPLGTELLEADDGDDGVALLVGTLAAILLFVALQTFGGYVLTGVVEEKSSAVIELLLVRIRAEHLLAGKVIGIGVAAMAQMVLAVAASVAALAISGVDVPTDIWSSVPMVLVWFVGGYALYSTLFAVAGSLVSRQEDAPAAAMPIYALMITAYVIVYVFGYIPEATASRILSVLPPTSPFLMPMRMAAGAASVVEVVVAVALLLASIVLAWKLTGKLYEQVLLRRGTRISWRSAAALVRSR